MSNYVRRMIDEGWNLHQFAAACAQAMAVERTYREVSPQHDQEIAAGLTRIEALLFLTDAEAREKQAVQLAELEARQREVKEQVARVDAMREQVERWEPGENVAAQGLKRFMLEELGRGPGIRLLQIHEAGIQELKTMTPQEFVEGIYQHERGLIRSHREAKETEAARSAEWRAWREALKAHGIELES